MYHALVFAKCAYLDSTILLSWRTTSTGINVINYVNSDKDLIMN